MYRILVVDDEENIREVIKEYAEFEGHPRRAMACRLSRW